MPKKNKNEKLTLQEYTELKKKREKKGFKFTVYPWPVTLALSIPFGIFLLLLLVYFFYMKNQGG